MRPGPARSSRPRANPPAHQLVRRAAQALAVAALFVGLALPLLGEEMPVPATVQAPMFVKIFPFVRSLGDRSDLHVWVTYAPAEKAQWSGAAAALAKSFTEAGVAAEPLPGDQLAGKLTRGNVVYLLPGATTPDLLDAIAAAKVLSISGAPALAERGHVSIGLGAKGGKPEIILHAGRLKAEGQEITAQLMGLARLVQ